MFPSLRLAWALVRLPHLAVSLFLVPLLLSILLIFVQLVATGLVLRQIEQLTSGAAQAPSVTPGSNLVHTVLYGSSANRPPLRVCRWQSEGGLEVPPSKECSPDRLDLALQVADPATFDSSRYERLFAGHVDRIHLCRSCQPDAVVRVDESGRITSSAYTFFGLLILFLPYTSSDIEQSRLVVRQSLENVRQLMGDVSMFVPEVAEGIGISTLTTTVPVVLNVSLLVLVSLWLALRAHRKVLDYFARNDVLLPLVAACGKERFYSAIWYLTVFRVGSFLVMSVPLFYFGLRDVIEQDLSSALGTSFLRSLMWLAALISTLAFATVVASIAELKHRQVLVSLAYRFLPLVAATVGASVWALSFMLPTETFGTFRLVVSAVPVIGTVPILVAPVVNMPTLPLATHALLATAAVLFILRRNARWFAAHLDEV